ncbi:MAG: hypothetical protein WD096_04135 [Actinomycetota bacterium]
MATWVLVWFVVALTTTVLFAAFVIALIRHALLLGRAASRLGEEAGVLLADIGRDSSQASERTSRISLKGRGVPRR